MQNPPLQQWTGGFVFVPPINIFFGFRRLASTEGLGWHMVLKIIQIDDFLVVSDAHGSARYYDVGDRCKFCKTSDNTIWVVSGQTLHKIIPARDKWEKLDLPYPATNCIPRRNGRTLLITFPWKVAEVAIDSVAEVDMETLQLREFPFSVSSSSVEAEDGVLVYPTKTGIKTVDLLQGRVDEQSAPYPNELAYSVRNHSFFAVSPDGKYCLRPDMSILLARKKPGLASLFGGEREYALSVELWETRPLRFVRSLTVAWLTWQEMPDEEDWRKPKDHRKSLYSTIAKISSQSYLSNGRFPNKKDYEAAHRGDDKEWDYVLSNWLVLAVQWAKNVTWAPDSCSFWCTVNGFVAQTHINGRHSPRIGLKRFGYSQNTWLPTTEYARTIEPLNSTDARLLYYLKGEATVRGALSENPASVMFVTDDQWAPFDPDIYNTTRSLKKDSNEKSRKLLLKLDGLDEASMRRAIQQLSDCIPKRIRKSARAGRIDISFQMKNKTMTDVEFFTHIGSQAPQTIDDVEKLLEKLIAHENRGSLDIWSDDRDSILFGHAAVAFAARHPSPWSLLRRFCRIVDYEHTRFVITRIMPALVQRFGWTSDMLDFAIWYIGDDAYYSDTSYEILTSSNFSESVSKTFTPQQFAEHIVERLNALHKDSIAEDGTGFMPAALDGFTNPFNRPKGTEHPWLMDMIAEVRSLRLQLYPR